MLRYLLTYSILGRSQCAKVEFSCRIEILHGSDRTWEKKIFASNSPDCTVQRSGGQMGHGLSLANNFFYFIAGDLNVHFEFPENPGVERVCRLLDSFGLVQHVTEPTHRYGGILDVVITRSDCSVGDLRWGALIAACT